MEPEHEIFFLGWRAHGLRAIECTTVSILHHGWRAAPFALPHTPTRAFAPHAFPVQRA